MLNFSKLSSVCILLSINLFSDVPSKVFPNALNVNSRTSASIQGNFIYWIPTQEGLYFAETKTHQTYEKRSAPYHVEPGYKVGLSLYPNFDGADLSFRFTWFNQPTKVKTYAVDPGLDCDINPDGKICEINAENLGYYSKPYQFMETIHAASSAWAFQIMEADIEFGKRFKISRSLFTRPYLGIKSIWQKQKFSIDYDLNFHQMLYLSESIESNQHSFGIGPRTGLDVKYRFNRRFGLFGNAAYSLISTRFKNGASINTYTESLASSQVFDSSKKVSEIQPVFESLIGIDFDTYYLKNRYHINYFLGWEFQYLVQNNHLIINPQDLRDGDLSLQGLNFKMQFDF